MNDDSTRAVQVRTMQVIWFGLVMGATFYAGIVLFLGMPKQPDQPLVSYIALAFAAGAVVMSLILPSVVGRQLANQALSSLPHDIPQETIMQSLMTAYQTRMIIALSILEGATFFVLVSYWIEGMWWTLVAAGILWLMLLARFPSPARVEEWCRSEYETAMLKRQ
jgi:hypothetical protein